MTIPFNYSFDSTSRECAKTDTLSLKSVIMRTIDYPKARNRPQPAGSNRRVDLAMRPAAEGRICPGSAKEGWGEWNGRTLGKSGLAKLGTQARSGLVRQGPPESEAGAHVPCVIRSLRSGPLEMAKDQGARALFANLAKMISRYPCLGTVHPTARSPIKAIERIAATTTSETPPAIIPA